MGVHQHPLEVMVQNERERTQKWVQEYLDECEQHIRSIEQHRRICMDLGGIEGISLYEYRYNLEIDLGERPKTKKGLREFGRKLKLVRDTLGRPMKLSHKSLMDEKKKLVRMYLRCDGYPDLTVFFTCKLGRNDRCKIVRKRVRGYTDTNLVCEI